GEWEAKAYGAQVRRRRAGDIERHEVGTEELDRHVGHRAGDERDDDELELALDAPPEDEEPQADDQGGKQVRPEDDHPLRDAKRRLLLEERNEVVFADALQDEESRRGAAA